MNTTSKFQLLFIGILVAAILGAVFLFATNKGSNVNKVTITIWGTTDKETFDKLRSRLATEKDVQLNINYVQISPATFDSTFVEALAVGRGPDVVILPQDLMLRHQNKIIPIPYKSFPARDFKDTYIQNAELYLSADGVLALPFTVDPMIMYWNRDLFSNASISKPPLYWDEFYALSDKITKKDSNLNITTSAVALGEYSNVANAKPLLSALLIQAGTPIVQRNNQGELRAVLNSVFDYTVSPGDATINFYTQFSNAVKPFYSWNRSLPNSKEMFLAGDLATYFGFASELPDLRRKNPNLNFDVAYLPQARGNTNTVTFGTMQGFAIVRQSANQTDAFNTVYSLTSKDAITMWQEITGLPPVRRDLLASAPTDSVGPVFYNSALWSRSWNDPSPEKTSKIFQAMIENVTSGRTRVGEALGRAQDELDNLLTN